MARDLAESRTRRQTAWAYLDQVAHQSAESADLCRQQFGPGAWSQAEIADEMLRLADLLIVGAREVTL